MNILSPSLTISEILTTINGKINTTNGKINTTYNNNLEIQNITNDSRDNAELFVAMKGDDFDGHDFLDKFFLNDSSKVAIVNKNIKISDKSKILIKVDDTRKAFGQISKLYKSKFNVKTIAITGSAGKTTVKEMIDIVLRKKYSVLSNIKNFNNDIGLPLTLFRLEKEHEIAVVEMGMNSFGEIKHLSEIAKPDIAVINNIGSAHIGMLGSKENIFKAKREILHGLKKNGTLILNGDDEFLSQINEDFQTIKFGIHAENLNLKASDINFSENTTEFTVNSDLKITINAVGKHLVYNALAAISVAKLLNMPNQDIQDALLEYKPLDQRQVVYNINNVTVIDDSYNSSPEALKNAIINTDILSKKSDFPKRKIAVLGSMRELGEYSKSEHEKIADLIFNYGFQYLFTLGEDAKFIHDKALKLGVKSFHFSNHEELIEKLKNIIRSNDIILIKGSKLIKLYIVAEALMEFLSKSTQLV